MIAQPVFLRRISCMAAAAVIGVFVHSLNAGPDEQYAGFRGPNGCGNSTIKQLPTSWNESEKENIAWRIPLDLPGWGAPFPALKAP